MKTTILNIIGKSTILIYCIIASFSCQSSQELNNDQVISYVIPLIGTSYSETLSSDFEVTNFSAANYLTNTGILTEVSATARSTITKNTYGQASDSANIIFDL